MAQYFFKIPFANSGNVATIPRPSQVDGSVSFEKGFPIDYELDPDSDPAALDIPRDQFNELMLLISGAINIVQVHGFPDFITTSDNDGSPYPYDINSTVRFTNGWAGAGALNYYSLVDSNTATPTDATKWGLVTYQKFELPGVCKEYMGASLPAGYVWANGTTIGNASSNGTGRANADTLALFTVLWGAYTNAVLPIFTSTGSASVRGVSAAADFAANKALSVPDKRGIVAAGADNMGGASAAGRITTAGCNIDGSTLGANGGAQNVSLTTGQLAAHAHTATTDTSGDHYHNATINDLGSPNAGGTIVSAATEFGLRDFSFSTDSAGVHTHDLTTSTVGSGTAHLNVQPTIISNFIISLGTT